jgi:hypothetical protein
MKNKLLFHIYNAILIFGLVLVFHTPHTQASVDYFNGKTSIVIASHVVFPAEPSVNGTIVNNEAIYTISDYTFKTQYLSKYLNKKFTNIPIPDYAFMLNHKLFKNTLNTDNQGLVPFPLRI